MTVLFVPSQWDLLKVLKRNLTVTNSGAPISVPVGPATLGRIMDVLGRLLMKGPVATEERLPIHRQAPSYAEQQASTEFLETGIKVIDLLCPFAKVVKLVCSVVRCW